MTPGHPRAAASPLRGEPRLLSDVFEETVRLHPDAVAVEVPPARGRPERLRWTYAELAAHTRRLASALEGLVREECVVALALPRTGPELYCAQLAVLAAGGAYTCLDPAFPPERVRTLIADSGAVAVLGDATWLSALADLGLPPEQLLDVHALLREAEPAAPARPAWLRPESLAYVIYTSGTSGVPKGVMIEQRGVLNLVRSDLEHFGLGPGDRVAQGSSPAYDSSVEEVWLALASGATLVVLDDEAARSGPDLVRWLREERITALCPPPTLLAATGCADPRGELPELALVYAGGEALPDELAWRWADGRRLVNGYGPTECTVTTLRADVRPGEEVTIGRPVVGHTAHILDADLEPVPEGEAGELCLSGPGLARGYLHLAAETRRAFPVHPRLGRLYRTGDLVRRDAAGDVHALGRSDSQIKLRGYRIELEAIEARLLACAGVRGAACRLQRSGRGELLAAHVVPLAPEEPPSFEELAVALRRVLPEYMLPSRWALRAELPLTTGGKLDRAALPDLADTRSSERTQAPPRDELEAALAGAFRSALELEGEASVTDDFFLDLGGTSISAALLISLLREDPRTASLAVRDVYEARTVRELACRAAGRSAAASEGAPADERRAPETSRPLVVTLAQAAVLAAGLVTGAAVLHLVLFVLLPLLLGGLGLTACLVFLPVFGLVAVLAWLPVSLLLVRAVKSLLIGRYRPLRAPLWSGFHLRHWIVERASALVPWGLLSGTELYCVALRALGAQVGERVHVHAGVDLSRGGWDLLSLGDGVTLSQESALRLVDLEAGELVVGPITLGTGCTLETRAGLSAHAALEDGASLRALSWLPRGGRIPAGEAWDGVPAGPAGEAPPAPEPTRGGPDLGVHAHTLATLAARFLRRTTLSYGPFLALGLACAWWWDVSASAVLAWLYEPGASLRVLPVVAAVVVLARCGALCASALGLRLLPRVRAGVLHRYSLAYLLVQAKTEALAAAGSVLSGTLYWPLWLRLAGMRVGPRCEVSTIIDVVPECIALGAESFLADGIYLGGPRVHRGRVVLAETSLGAGTFVGNHAVIPAGAQLPPNILVGVSTVADCGTIREGQSWFGHPAFELPRREVVEVERSLTHEPDAARIVTRHFWESLRFGLPLLPVLLAIAWVWWLAPLQAAAGGPGYWLLALPLTTLAAAALSCLVVLGLKWSLLGRVRPGQHALWSCWCGRWDFLYVAWSAWASGVLSALEGTLLLAWWLRAMGASVGRRVALGRGFAQVVDPDMLHFEDGASVNGLFQAHSFEDRVLKIDRVRLGRAASTGGAAVLFYGAVVGAGARVAPHGVVMKHERLTAGETYVGVPTRPC